MLASERAPYDAFLELRASEHPQDGLMGCDPHDALMGGALYDGIRGLYRHTRVAAHYSVMEVTPNQTILGVLARSPL